MTNGIILGVAHTPPNFDVPQKACDCHVHVFESRVLGAHLLFAHEKLHLARSIAEAHEGQAAGNWKTVSVPVRASGSERTT